MPTDIQRVALITGGNRGLGFEVARQLGRRGITVIIGSRDPEKGSRAEHELSAGGCNAHSVVLDVAEARSIQAAVAKIRDTFRRLDILVNNAGIQIDAHTPIQELGLTQLLNTITTNAFGPLLITQACIPVMRQNGYGRIVNMSSTLGSISDFASAHSSYPELLSPAYRLSKTLLNGITLLTARELAGSNVLINAACPGWVRTDMGGDRAPLNVEEGADTPVWLATLPDGGPSGGFFREHKPIPW